MTEKIVIIGNGIAAITAIKSIREIDQESTIHLFGEEVFYPYNRVRLSKGLLSTLQEDKILLQKKEWYKDNKVNLYLDTPVVSVDTDKKAVKLSDHSLVNYTKLLIATGSHNLVPKVLGIEKPSVHTLKSLQDAWDIIDGLEDNHRIAIIGGGIQGLETAWILSQMGKEVVILHHSHRLMRKQLDEKSSEILEKAIRSCGIEIIFDTIVTEIVGDDRVEGFKTKSGQLVPCDSLIYSIGTKPNVEFLEGAGISIDEGILVNEKMETNIPDIFAAGDVAEYDSELYGLWSIAIGQGKVAGYNMSGKDSSYSYITPVITLNAFNLSLFSMGIVDESKATDIILEDKSSENIYNKIFINNNKIIGAIVVGNLRSSPALKAAIEKETNLEGIDFQSTSMDDLIQILKTK